MRESELKKGGRDLSFSFEPPDLGEKGKRMRATKKEWRRFLTQEGEKKGRKDLERSLRRFLDSHGKSERREKKGEWQRAV